MNVHESEREQTRIIRGNFVVGDWRGLLFEVPPVETGVITHSSETGRLDASGLSRETSHLVGYAPPYARGDIVFDQRSHRCPNDAADR